MRPVRSGGRLLALSFVAVMAVAACSSTDTGLVTYTDEDRLSRFDLPSDWNLYQFNEISGLSDLPFDEAVQGMSFPAVVSMGFDAAPVRDVESLAEPLTEADYPIGAAHVRSVGQSERDYLSRAVLTQSVVPYYGLANPQELQKEDFTFGDGFDGVRVLFAFEGSSGAEQGVAYMISVSDPLDNRIYSIVAGCKRECFIANQDEITKVVDSWLVNKKG
jgi:hypothetical protein